MFKNGVSVSLRSLGGRWFLSRGRGGACVSRPVMRPLSGLPGFFWFGRGVSELNLVAARLGIRTSGHPSPEQTRKIRRIPTAGRSGEDTAELQPLMHISYSVFCLN